MTRMVFTRSTYMTASIRRRFEIPSSTNRSSVCECRGSARIRPSGSPKTVAASSNEILCLTAFFAALFGSHSNSSPNSYLSRVFRHGAATSLGGSPNHKLFRKLGCRRATRISTPYSVLVCSYECCCCPFFRRAARYATFSEPTATEAEVLLDVIAQDCIPL